MFDVLAFMDFFKTGLTYGLIIGFSSLFFWKGVNYCIKLLNL